MVTLEQAQAQLQKHKIFEVIPNLKEGVKRTRIGKLMSRETRNNLCCVRCRIQGQFILKYQTLGEYNKAQKGYHHDVFAITPEGRWIFLTIDHILPLSWGGVNYHTNYQIMCTTCNKSKGNTISDQDWVMILANRDRHVGPTRRHHTLFNSALLEHRPSVVHNSLLG